MREKGFANHADVVLRWMLFLVNLLLLITHSCCPQCNVSWRWDQVWVSLGSLSSAFGPLHFFFNGDRVRRP
jgi:hypothetical protein